MYRINTPFNKIKLTKQNYLLYIYKSEEDNFFGILINLKHDNVHFLGQIIDFSGNKT